MTLRLALTSLMACGAFALGCGDSGGGTVITPDAADTDAAVDAPADAATDDAPDAVEDTAPPTDNPQPVDAPEDTAPVDAPEDTAAMDVPVDMAPVDVPVDMTVMDVPVDMGVDASVDVAMDVPVDMAPVDVPMDIPPVDTGVAGHRATSLVGAGGVMRSPSYRMVSTLGQSTIHQTVMRSTGFRLNGGVVGASGGSR